MHICDEELDKDGDEEEEDDKSEKLDECDGLETKRRLAAVCASSLPISRTLAPKHSTHVTVRHNDFDAIVIQFTCSLTENSTTGNRFLQRAKVKRSADVHTVTEPYAYAKNRRRPGGIVLQVACVCV